MSKILLNGLHYDLNGAGISKYTHQLLEAFLKGSYEVDILMRKNFKETYRDERIDYVDKDVSSSTKRIIEEQVNQMKCYKSYDLVHFPDYATPVFYKGAKIATIHDMAMHTMRDKYTLMQNITKNVLLHHTIKQADRLICVSEFSKKELLHYYPEVEDKVNVIYEGITIPKWALNVDKQKESLKQLGINSPFILYVGTIAPHKNIDGLIKAFAKVKIASPDYKLVIAGRKGWMYEEVFKSVETLGLKNEVVFTDFVSNEEIEILYANAELFVSASLYEGFGFPPLEAMGRGCPVAVSDIEVFKETCQDYVLYFNPQNTDEMAKRLLTILNNKELKSKLAEEGRERVKYFNWDKAAKETYEVYLDVLQKRGLNK